MHSLVSKVYTHSQQTPDRPALSNSIDSITYSQLARRINAAYQLLIDKGVNRDKSIIACATKNFGFVYCYLAAHKLGATITPLDPTTPRDRINYIKDCLGDSIVIWDDSQKCDMSMTTFDELSGLPGSLEHPEDDNPADIIFTSGTTGKPKGVILTQKNIVSAIRNINSTIQLMHTDIELIPMPLSHSFGLARLRCALYEGIEAVLHPGLSNLKKLFSVIDAKGITGVGMVAPGWALLKKLSGDYVKKFKDQLRYIEFGSAPMPLSDKKELVSLLPNTKIYMHYGMTEASRSTFIEFNSEQQYLHSIGRPSTYADIKIFSPEGKALPSGVEGEICVKGEFVAKKFIGAAISDLFYGEHYRSGDLGFSDQFGYIYLTGRLKEMINVGGHKVNPVEIEEQINSNPYVEESACLPVADTDGVSGDRICAVIVPSHSYLKEKVSLDLINEYLKSRVESYKIPHSIILVDSLPKTNSGKIERYKLIKMIDGIQDDNKPF